MRLLFSVLLIVFISSPKLFPRPAVSPSPHFNTASLSDALVETSMLFRVYALYASYLHLPHLWITRSGMSPHAASVVAPPIRNECRANSSGFRPDFATTSSISRRARPYLTALTVLPHRYAEKGNLVGQTRKAWHQPQRKGNGLAVRPKG